MVSEVGISGVLEWEELAYTYGFFCTHRQTQWFKKIQRPGSLASGFSFSQHLRACKLTPCYALPLLCHTWQDQIQRKNENPIFLSSRRRLHVVFETGCWLVSLSALAATRHQNRPRRDVSFQPTAQGSRQNSDMFVTASPSEKLHLWLYYHCPS